MPQGTLAAAVVLGLGGLCPVLQLQETKPCLTLLLKRRWDCVKEQNTFQADNSHSVLFLVHASSRAISGQTSWTLCFLLAGVLHSTGNVVLPFRHPRDGGGHGVGGLTNTLPA